MIPATAIENALANLPFELRAKVHSVLMKFSLICFSVFAISAIPAFPQTTNAACTATHYKVIRLPIQPLRANDAGVIVGTTEEKHLATWSEKDGLREIPIPQGFSAAEVTGINREGDVSGFATKAGSEQTLAFQYSHGKFVLLSEDLSRATAINDSGDTAGQDGQRLVLWSKGGKSTLGGCCGGSIRAMNNHGEIVGQLNDKQGKYGAFSWSQQDGLRSIAPTDATSSSAVAVNDAGDVLVQSVAPSGAYLLRNGKPETVQLAAEGVSQPLAMNACDVVVGEFGAASDFYHAFVWDRSHGFTDLNQRIAAGTQWTLESAVDINTRGEIIGIGDYGDEEDLGYLLVPEPSAAPRQATPRK